VNNIDNPALKRWAIFFFAPTDGEVDRTALETRYADFKMCWMPRIGMMTQSE
jgi:hypothetical protein